MIEELYAFWVSSPMGQFLIYFHYFVAREEVPIEKFWALGLQKRMVLHTEEYSF